MTRPTYWEISLALLREGYAGWQERRPGRWADVAANLALDAREVREHIRDLADHGLVKPPDTHDEVRRSEFTILPKGRALVEGVPTLEQVLAQRVAVIDTAEAPPEEKRQATFRLRDELWKVAIDKGADAAIQQLPVIWLRVQHLYEWTRALIG